MANGVAVTHPGELNYLEAKSKYNGLLSWLLTTDHKKIAILYLIGMMAFFLTGMLLGLLIRLELLYPGPTIMNAQTYNSVFTLHGVIMIFLFIIPGLPAVFGNFALPIMLGAKDVSFPRVNLLSWYCYMAGAAMALISLVVGAGPIDTGWTFYVPYSTRTISNVSLPLLAAWILGMSSILTGVNFVTTMHRLRAPGMSWLRMPLFPWSLYATGWIQVLATPVVGITILMVVLERTVGVAIFDPASGGDPILFQHLFWIYSHPAVYIMVLPALGALADIITTHAHKPIFGYKSMVIASVLIAVFGYLVWAHHMFTSGMSDFAKVVFSFLTFTVAIPSAIKVFNYVATLHKASIVMTAPMVLALFTVYNFTVGGLTGMFLGSLGSDIHVHDTYFVVGHFHYVMFGTTGFTFFAALHHWFPKMFGRMYNSTKAIVWSTVFFIGFQILYMPMFVIGYMGMPRRYFDYLPEFHTGHVISTIGSWVLAVGIIGLVLNLLEGVWKGERASTNPWGGVTLEWFVPSPPPTLNFDKIPTVTRDPYEYENYLPYLKAAPEYPVTPEAEQALLKELQEQGNTEIGPENASDKPE